MRLAMNWSQPFLLTRVLAPRTNMKRVSIRDICGSLAARRVVYVHVYVTCALPASVEWKVGFLFAWPDLLNLPHAAEHAAVPLHLNFLCYGSSLTRA